MTHPTRIAHKWLIALAGIAATLIAAAANAQTIPNGGVAQANREISVYKTVNGGYPPGGMPLVKRVMTDADGYFNATALPAATNFVVDMNGAQNATATYAAINAITAHNARAMPAGGDFEGRAIKYANGTYRLEACDRNSQNAAMLHICKPKRIVEPLRNQGLPTTQ
jgi:hypothetical protein